MLHADPGQRVSIEIGGKSFPAGWVESLSRRGGPMDARIRGSKQEGTLQHIGMTVGGIGCGTVYLGGDGRLWVWDIFNQHHEGVVANRPELPPHLLERYESVEHQTTTLLERDGANYIDPPTPDRFPGEVRQGFGLRVGERFQRFAEPDWADVSFEGRWPVGEVRYRDPGTPVEVTLRAFSPFIPLELDDSSLPLTCMEFTVSNTSGVPVEATLSGWLDNAVGVHSRQSAAWDLRSARSCHSDFSILHHEGSPLVGDPSDADKPDFGSMALAARGEGLHAIDQDGIPGWGSRMTLRPGESRKVVFLVTWHFRNMHPLWGFPAPKRHYGARFADAAAVARFAAEHHDRLAERTRCWVATWYDSTLPAWFMDRTVLPTNTLQTATCLIFEDGQFWAWEGVGACEGTCTHVWMYAQGPARLFPAIERNLRQVTDYGYAQNPETGLVSFRGKNRTSAVDGHAGIILRTLREHQVSADAQFLLQVWPRCKLAIEGLMRLDEDRDGLIDGAQHNTLDSDWYGEVAWLSGLYLAAVRAGEQLAREVGELTFAGECGRLAERGAVRLVERLYDRRLGYFINRPDPAFPASVNSGTGCHIDQVFGQSWAFQVGLGRVLPETETRNALRALWHHNFMTDVGPWRLANKPGRWYAVPGESGLVMTTYPSPDWDYTKSLGVGAKDAWSAKYFNENMTGFEYQVASHMIWEGEPDLVNMGLAITRAVHDRYSPAKRNPYNEIECSDHYARAAASHGIFLAACGFEYDGPSGRIGFAPRLSPEDFRAPFTAAEGWGIFSQRQVDGRMQAELAVRHGRLALRTLVLTPPAGSQPAAVAVTVAGRDVPASLALVDGRVQVRFAEDLFLDQDDVLSVSL